MKTVTEENVSKRKRIGMDTAKTLVWTDNNKSKLDEIRRFLKKMESMHASIHVQVLCTYRFRRILLYINLLLTISDLSLLLLP